ncbi:MAG: rhomboid family intramembrane serine protease [Pseudomonadota bacterium]
MFIPLQDRNELKHVRLQYVTLALILVNCLVYVGINLSGGAAATESLVIQLGYIPAVVNDVQELPVGLAIIPEELSLISYAFLHADFLHLASNMLFLWVFGDNVEDALGHFRFLVFYLLCAIAGGIAHGLVDPSSAIPLIGASGAVAGIIGAYLMLHPRVRVWVLVLMRIPLPLPAWIPLLGWIGFQIFMLVTGGDEMVSWAAHVGGFFAGALLVFVLKRRAVPLFDRQMQMPTAVVKSVPGVKRDGNISRPETDTRSPDKTKVWGRGK